MIKKILLLLTVCLMAQGLWAQNGVGEWRLHVPFVGKNVTTVAEGNQWVYYLAGGNLFRLDKNTSENESLSVINDLSDMTISQIYYNTDRDYLVVVYSNSNIDVILGDGSVVNMPEIKDAVMTSSKVINDVTFASGKIYVATGFGYVVIDDAKFVVKESHMYGEPVVSVAQVGDMLLMSTASAFYYGAASDYHEQLSSFKTGSCKTNCRIWPISESTFFCMTGWTYVATMKRADDGTATFSTSTIIEGRSTTPQATTGGFLLNVPGKGQCFKTGPDGFNPVAVDVTDEVCSGHPSGNNTLWAACEEGLHVVGTETFFRPNAMSIASPFWMTYNKSSDLLYVTPPSANGFFSTTTPMEVNTYNGITWHDVTPEGAPTNGCYWIEFMPDDPNTYFIGTWRDGLLKVVDGEIAFKYDESNSPLKSAYSMHPITSIDRFGNLWVAQPLENEQHPIMVLPAAKAKQPQTTASDWYTPVIDGTYTKHTQRGRFLSTRYSNYDIKVFTDGDYEMPIFFWNSNGDVSISRPRPGVLQLPHRPGWAAVLVDQHHVPGRGPERHRVDGLQRGRRVVQSGTGVLGRLQGQPHQGATQRWHRYGRLPARRHTGQRHRRRWRQPQVARHTIVGTVPGECRWLAHHQPLQHDQQPAGIQHGLSGVLQSQQQLGVCDHAGRLV